MTEIVDRIKADALEAQRFSRKHLVLELDFSEFSIRELEANIDSVEYAVRGGKSPENVAMLTRIWGAYLGESIRKCRGGEWVEQEGQLVLQCGPHVVLPHQCVQQRLQTAGANLWEFFRQTVHMLPSS